MSRSIPDKDALVPPGSPFALPPARRRIGAPAPGTEETPLRLPTMLAISFVLVSPLITLLLALP